MSNSVQELFNVSDQLAKNLEITHKLAVPKISKIVINAGIGAIKEDNKAIEKIKKDLSLRDLALSASGLPYSASFSP